jgi:HAMP domain-containing protein
VSKRHTARSRDRWQSVLGFLLIATLALVALYVWRGIQGTSSRLAPAASQGPAAEPRSRPPESGEEFSEAERRSLEEVLRRHGGGKSR